jgi:eukaryotic-like serine/threonine-protein kinase
MSASQLPTARARTRTTAITRAAEPTAAEPTAAEPTAGSETPAVLGRYRLRRRLGAGAFGTVWAARDERLERDVAVKILPRERIVGGRFEREARAAARLSHPAIVTLYEAAVDDDGAYLVSELVRGATLGRLVEQGKLSDRDIAEIAIALCDALEHAHGEGVVHRDVKPSNVLVPQRPTSPTHPAKLTDFGVARVIGGDTLTRTGDVVGTAAYMAPEQAEGREAGEAADLYSLSLVVYEALTGVNPVRTTTAATRARRLGAHLPPLRRQRRDLPRELGCAVDLALRPRPRERGTIAELRRAIAESLPRLDDRPGVVTASFARGGFSHVTHPPRPARRSGREIAPIEFSDPAAEPEPDTPRADAGRPEPLFASEPAAWPWRGAGALGAAATAAWLTPRLVGSGRLAPDLAGVAAAIAVLLLPRAGWLVTGVSLAAAAGISGHAGGALLLLPAIAVPVVLLPRRGVAWPLPAGAVALGLVGLAGAWPVLAAALGRTFWRRAALGAAGWIWVVLATPLAGTLYAPFPRPLPAREVWTASVQVSINDVIAPLVNSGRLLPAVVWALAAATAPWAGRGRSFAADAVRVTIWSAGLLLATEVALTVGRVQGTGTPRGAVIGAVLAAAVALAPAAYRAWRATVRSASPREQLP